jgi:hypothetical protein
MNENPLTHWSIYHDYISEKFLYVCKDRKVLEIASFNGHQTLAIQHNQPSDLLLVEPNTETVTTLESKFPEAEIISQDIFEVYKNDLPADVVVCCGLLYHLHCPIYLLELIVEKSDPEFIILDSTNVKDFTHGQEKINEPGHRYSALKKTAGLYVVFPHQYINQALENLGYAMTIYHELEDLKIHTKENWMAMWRKK